MFTPRFEGLGRGQSPVGAFRAMGKRALENEEKATESNKRGRLNNGGFSGPSNDVKDGMERLGRAQFNPGNGYSISGPPSASSNPYVQFKVLTGAMESFPVPKPWAQLGITKIAQGYDGGFTVGRDDQFNNTPLRKDIQVVLKDYAEFGFSKARQLQDHLSTGSPLFVTELCVPGLRGRPSEYPKCSNLAQINMLLYNHRGSHWKMVDSVFGDLKLIGYAFAVVETPNRRDIMEVLLSYTYDGPHRAINIWAKCHLKPTAGRYLCLLLVKRTIGFETKEEEAYRSEDHMRVLRVHREVVEACRLSRREEKDIDVDKMRYWKIIPHVSETAQVDRHWIKGVDWEGAYWIVGRDSGLDVEAINSNMADQAVEFVTKTFSSAFDSDQAMSKSVAKTTINLGCKAIKPV